MSSKRGRKRNDSLPPNRARDVQRAFRARRAAHLESLQERVDILEEENTRLRELLQMPPSMRPLLGRGPTGKDKPRMHGRTYANMVGSEVARQVTPSTEPSSAKTTSSGSPTASQVWGSLPIGVQSVDNLNWVGHESNLHGGEGLQPGRSPPAIALPKSSPYPIQPPSHSPPLRQVPVDGSFYPTPPQYQSDRASSTTESYTPATPGSSPPVFMLREFPRDNDSFHSYPYQQNYTAQSQHSTVSCELPLPTPPNHPLSHSPPHTSRGSSVDSTLGHKRAGTNPDVGSLLGLPGGGNFAHQALHSHLRHSDTRSSLSHIPSIMHAAPEIECRPYGP